MALKNVNDVEKNVKEIEFDVAKEVFDKAVNAAYKKNVGKMNVPGFRKGKAPKAMIEKIYGKGIFYDEALNEVLPEAYEEAVKASALEVVSRPDFEVVSIDENGVVMKAKVTVKPEVKVEGYKGIAVDKIVEPTTDEEIDAEIEAARKKNAREVEITDRAAQEGDIAVIDYEGFVGDKAFEGGKGEDHNLKLGSGEFIPGFEEQVAGHNVGESFDVNVKFPEEYHSEELSGKDATFKVTLKAIKFNELPEIDDEFAKDNGFDTLDEYKADLKATIDQRHAKAAEDKAETDLIDALTEKLEADIPEAMFENEVEQGKRDLASRLAAQGLDYKLYLQYTGMTDEDLSKQLRPRAEKQVRTRLALEAVAAAENIEATEEDVNKEYEEIAKAYGIEAEDVKAQLDAAMLIGDIKVRKAVELVKANAVITEKAAETKSEEQTEENA